MSVIRILVADDHQIMRKALVALLENEEEMVVVGEANNGREAVELAATLAPDLVLMDAAMPLLGGIEATRRIVKKDPLVKVIALSRYKKQDAVLGMFEAGARAYVHKGAKPEELFEAIRAVLDGERFISPTLGGRMMANLLDHLATGQSPEATLSTRQMEVVQLLAEGYSNTEIARQLELDRRTVDNHRLDAMKKLGLRSTAALIKWAIKKGITEPDP